MGNVGPFYPESVTWKFKRPQGIAVPDLTKAERDTLEEANVNFLTVEYKREYVKNGTCLNGEFIDVQMGADYIAKTMRENLYDIFLENAKIGYTDEGFAIIADGVFQALNRLWTWASLPWIPRAARGSTPSPCPSGLKPPMSRPVTGRCPTSPGRPSLKVPFMV